MPSWLALLFITFAATGVIMHVNFADEVVFVLFLGWVLLTLVNSFGNINKSAAKQSLIIGVALLVAFFVALIKHIPLMVSFMGFWQIWRAHIAILVGLILLSYRKHISSWPIIIVLQFNAVFSFIQPWLGERLMTLLYPAGVMEYRSGILRSVGIFANPNTNAFILSFYLLFLWSHILHRTEGRFGKVLFLITFSALFFTGSRTGILVVPLLLTYMAWASHRAASATKKKLKTSLLTYLMGLVFVLGMGGYLLIHDADSTSGGYSLIPDMSVVTNTDNLGEGYFRAIATLKAIDRFTDHPIVGLGYGTYGTPASFAWHSPYLESDGLLDGVGGESETGAVLTQLDVLLPVVLAESGLVGSILWAWSLWMLSQLFLRYSHQSGIVFSAWLISLLLAALSGPGITSPVVIALIPFVMSLLANSQGEKLKRRT